MSSIPYFSAYLSAPQEVPTGVPTRIKFDAKDFDSDGCYDHTTEHRFTPRRAGKYRVHASYIATGRALTICALRIHKNGVPVNEVSTIHVRSAQPTGSVSAIIDMNGTTDFVEIWVSITGMNPVLAGGNAPRYTWLDAQYVGP